MVGYFSCAIVTIHNFCSLQDLLQKMHYEAKEYASRPRTRRALKMWRESHPVVLSIFNGQRVIIINGDKQLLSTEDRESIEKYAAEEGMTILE